ncbi:MAG: helix-turn-helix domain-containing protein [Gammaproteobacteria bacterium]
MTLELGAQIAAARKRLQLSQAEVAARAGVSRQTVSYIETGRNPEVGLGTLHRVLQVMGLTLTLGPTEPLPSRSDIAAHRRRVLGG